VDHWMMSREQGGDDLEDDFEIEDVLLKKATMMMTVMVV